jgi:putative peptide zinc metalloprotease protein
MTTLAESLINSASRPVRLRMRPDLSARQHRYHGKIFWVIKEPVGLNYFRFHEEEYAILQMIDGHTSLDEMKEQFEHEFTPQKITYQDLQQFIGMLHRSGLLISDAPGQGRELKKRGDQKWRREVLGKLANVFSLRFRGIDPERILNWLYRYTFWFFSPAFFVVWLGLALAALALVGVQFETFRLRLPTFHQFFAAENWFYLAITMAVVKVLHEFGHGLSCKHFGGECHEMGFMLLVFTPALYCNVSDSWMLPSKWKRAAIGAAGMYVEIFLASIATFIWWFSEPGVLNYVALAVMFICSVSTIVFNGNPLLRFDGYYILMDLSEIPNLRQKSTEVCKRFLVDLCLGIEQPESPFLPQRNRLLFGLFTVAAVIYRWVVVFSIMFFLNRVFEPYGLKIIGQLIALSGFIGLVVQPLWQLGKFFYTPGRMHKVKKPRLYGTIAAIAATLAFVVFVPLPFRVKCAVEVRPRNAQWIYAEVPGRLDSLRVRPGDHVDAEMTLVTLKNYDLQREVKELEGQLVDAETEMLNIQSQSRYDRKAVQQLQPLMQRIFALKNELKEKRSKLSHLDVRSPIAGTVMAPPAKSAKGKPDGRLAGWSGTPFEAKNADAFFLPSELLCLVGDPRDMEAVLVIDQSDIDFVHTGDPVSIRLDAYPSHTLVSKIEQISNDKLEVCPPSLSVQGGGEIDTRADATGVQRPISTQYQARTGALDADAMKLEMGFRGRGKISAKWQSLGFRLYRYVAKTFHFEL